MAQDVWTGSGDWNVNQTTDWSTGAAPTSSQNAEITSGSNNTLSTSGVANELTVDSGGTLTLDSGATLTTQSFLDNAGVWQFTGGGNNVTLGNGSQGGALVNSGATYIGNTGLTASTTVTATGFFNFSTSSTTGYLSLQGNVTDGTTDQATLDITGATSSVVSGTVRVLGDADLELTSAITAVGYGAFFQIDGADARASLGAATTSTAITGLAISEGTVNFDGNCSLGYGGTVVTTTTGFLNGQNGVLWVDYYGGDGGTQVTFGGTLTNTGTAIIGNTSQGTAALGGDTVVKANLLVNTGSLHVLGNVTSGTTKQTSLLISGAASANWTGSLQVGGDGLLQFASGSITSVESDGYLELDGAQARILTNNGALSALAGLTTNYGTLLLRGGNNYGAGGAVLNTTSGTNFANYSVFDVDTFGNDGGSQVSFGGVFSNNATLANLGTTIGNTSLSASTKVSATGLTNNGTLFLEGNAGNGTTDQALLDISGAAFANVTGYLRVSGDAVLQFASGSIASVTAGSGLELDGSLAKILGAGGSSSALSSLTTNYGTLLLRGGSNLGAGGAVLTTTSGTNFANYAVFDVDNYGNDGGSQVSFGGVFSNNATLANLGTTIGNTSLSASTKVSATGLTNNGTLFLEGNGGSGTTDQALLDISGAAFANVTGYLRVSGDATLQFGSGSIASVTAGSGLELDGSLAQILSTGGSSSGLSGLTANYGTLLLRGGSNLGAGGAVLTTTSGTNFANYAVFDVDNYGNDGGSQVSFGGVFTNDGILQNLGTTIGNTSLSASTKVTATGLVSQGVLTVQGNDISGTANNAELNITGAAFASVTGYLRVGGDATLQFASGSIASVAAGSGLELDGSQAQILSTGGSSSGLSGLTANYGTLLLRGASNLGANGASLTTKSGTAFTNYAVVQVDYYGNDGGSQANFGGVFTNDGILQNLGTTIGNTSLTSSTTVTATGLVSKGALTVQGNDISGTSNKAELNITGAAFASVTGYLRVGGDAVLQFASGSIASITAGSGLELDGSQAKILSTGGTSSGLSGLTANYGTLLLRGDTNLGANGASLTTTSGTAFTNHGIFEVDYYGNDGGSQVSFGGVFTNDAILPNLGTTIGNTSLSASTMVTATGLVNNGALTLQGNTISGTTNEAELDITGAAFANVIGYLRVSGDALLQFASGSIASIQTGAGLELDGSEARILSTGGTSSGLSGLTANYGTLLLRGDSYYGAGGASLTTKSGTAFTNYATFEVDYYGNDGGSSATFGGAFTNEGAMTIGNTSLSAATTVQAASFSNSRSGALTIDGSSATDLAELLLTGDASNAGDITLNAYGEINLGTHTFTQTGGTATIGGTLIAGTIDANGGLLDFSNAVTSVNLVGALNIGAFGALEFNSSADSSHTVQFSASTGFLDLGDTAGFDATIKGFGGQDAIDLLGVKLNLSDPFSFSGGVLTLNLSGGGTDTLHISGTYTTGNFSTASDTNGGTLVLYQTSASTEDVWTGSGTWSTNLSDWSTGSAPTSSQNVEITSSSSNTLNTSGVANELSIDSGGNLTLGSGATLTTSSFLDNAGTFQLDSGGANTVSLGGALVNSGTTYIGSTGQTAAATVTATGLDNTTTGYLELQGNINVGTSDQSTLDITGASPGVVLGTIRVLGDADLELTSAITYVGYGGFLQVDGTDARVSLGAATTSTALGGLSGSEGTFNVDGNCDLGYGGGDVTTTTGFTNGSNGTLWVDYYGGDGGSQLSYGGTLTNIGTAIIGNSSQGNSALGGNTVVKAEGLVNAGSLSVLGNATSGTTHQTSLLISGAASTAWTGALRVGGDGLLQFASGSITSVQAGSSLEVDGAQAQILTNNGALSALTTFTANYGVLSLQGDSSYGAGGVALTTTSGTAFTNDATFNVDTSGATGGSQVSFGGLFTNDGATTIGSESLSASTKVSATGLVNNGSLILQGNPTSGTTDQALLDIGGAAFASSAGALRVSGDAVLEFASGSITSVQSDGDLELDGAQAQILTSGGSSSGLASLSANYGTLSLQGDTGYGAGGAILTTTGGTAFANDATFDVDTAGSAGGSQVSFGGAFANNGATTIGNTGLASSTKVTATALTNNASLTLQGNAANGTTEQAMLAVTGAAFASSAGYLRVSGDAVLKFASGSITSVQADGWLELDGSLAQILSGSSSALASLTANHGTLMLNGNSGYGAGGAVLATKSGTAFTNDATFDVDSYYYSTGGSSVSFGGVFVNDGATTIGNGGLDALTTVTATGLVNNGSLTLQGNESSGTSNEVELDVTGAAFASSAGYLRVGGDALLKFASGFITSVQADGWLELDGAQAQILTSGGSSSALNELTANHGTLVLRGDSGLGPGGAVLDTKSGTAFDNYATFDVDSYNYTDAGSTVNFGGVFTNNGVTTIGNGGMTASTNVTATGLVNTDSLTVQGNTTSGTTNKATLDITGAAFAASAGYLRVGGDAVLQFASGSITSVQAAGWLELDGAQAQILSGSSSALSVLTANHGTLVLRGDSSLGAGGAVLDTTSGTAFVNDATFDVDSYQYADAGSSVNFGGVFTNNGVTTIGNGGMTALTNVTATGLVNTGSLTLQGNASSGTTNRATLDDTGAAPAVSNGFLRVGGDAVLQFATGSITTVQSGGWLELDGSQAQILTSGGSSSGLGGLTTNEGTLLLRGDSNLGAGGAVLSTKSGTAFTNDATLDVDSYQYGDSGSSATFGGAFTNDGTTTIGNTGMSAATSVTASSLSNSGSLTIDGSGTATAELSLNGDATNTGDISENADGEINVGTHTFTQSAGTATLAGKLVASTVDANGGLLDFTDAITSGDGVGALNIGAFGALEFDAGVDSSHTVQFNAATGFLNLGDLAGFDATIKDFGGNDAIDLLGVQLSATDPLTYSGGVLTLNLLGGGTDTLNVSGSYTTNSFATASDGHGGTLVLDPRNA